MKTHEDFYLMVQVTDDKFIDEWDCIFRQKDVDKNSQTFYLIFLRNLLKFKSYVALAYMTGILPIKKYGEISERYDISQ